MTKGNNVGPDKQEDIWLALSKVSLDLLDPYRAVDELENTSANLSFTDRFNPGEEDLDDFDWTGITFDDKASYAEYTFTEENVIEKKLDWSELCQNIERSIAKGYLWEAEPMESSFTPQISMVQNDKHHTSKQDVHRLVKQWDRFPKNNVDIFNPDDKVLEASYKVVNNFEMNVPLKIYSQDEEFVIKADLPDIVFNSAATGEIIFPEKLSFKSVLALLPDRINTRQLQPTFIDGEFRLELPKREVRKTKKIGK